MKIFANNKAYVQNNDLAYLMRGAEGISIPASIFNKVFGKVFIVTDENRYDFVEFTEPAEIEFFKECDWMVDYNAFDNMTEEEIIQIGCKINEERNKIAQAFNELKQKEKEKQYHKVSTQIELLEFKMMSVRDVLWHKQGHLKFPLPKGIEANGINTQSPVEPTSETTIEEVTQPEQEPKKKESAFQKVLSRFRRR